MWMSFRIVAMQKSFEGMGNGNDQHTFLSLGSGRRPAGSTNDGARQKRIHRATKRGKHDVNLVLS